MTHQNVLSIESMDAEIPFATERQTHTYIIWNKVPSECLPPKQYAGRKQNGCFLFYMTVVIYTDAPHSTKASRD